MSKIDGGPAFQNTGNITWELKPSGGMTLRDWFAGMALSHPYTHDDGRRQIPNADEIADYAYLIADAMLAERLKSGALC
jgi:hypothetical protein